MRVIRGVVTSSGVVTSIGASDAVTDAEISVAIDKSDLDTVIAAFKYNQKFPMRTLSDGTGHFTFGGIVPGKFTITVQRDGFFANSPDAKGNFRDSVSVDVTVVADRDGPEIPVLMLAGAVIAGRVSGSDGMPVPRVSVAAFSPYMEDGVRKLKTVVSRDTNDEGEFRLFWLPPAEYLVGFSNMLGQGIEKFIVTGTSSHVYAKTFYPDAPDEATASRVTVKSGDELSGIDIRLIPASPDLRLPPPPPPPPPPPGR